MPAKNDQKKNLLFFVAEDWYFVSHRLPIAVAAMNAGYNVSVVTNTRLHGDYIRGKGIKLIPLELSRRSINPVSELKVITKLISIYRSEQPDIVHNVALKPVLYGTLAARILKVPQIVNALAGLGLIFSSNSKKIRLIRPVMKLIFRLLLNQKNSRVILQNPDDVHLMCDGNILSKERVALIRGSGVDTKEFQMRPEPQDELIVILASRMLWDKGVGEFVKAAKQLVQQDVDARFVLVGQGDAENPSAISNEQLQEWDDEGTIEWWGHREDMSEVFSKSNIVCLPSYYGEGVPKVLIEAASCGRPIVTTDMPGCREIVQDGVNGLLIPARDVSALADALKKLIDFKELRQEMGGKGRHIVEREFSIEKVNSETLKIYKDLLA